jgi:NAD(P)-dependent dehydrogenase (short-subunit alcohol dehydrogenase family)
MSSKFNAQSTADQVLSGLTLHDKRILITGAASGIGLETARSLASHGATIVGTVRSMPKADEAVAVVRDAALRGGGHLELLELDLASLQSVRAGVDKLLSEGQRFDVIIGNAGIMAPPFGQTVDGFESQFGTNFLGHFALVNWLEPLLADNARVVLLSSQAHRVADVDLQDPNFERRAYDPFVAYGRSKTAIALLAVELERRHRARGIHAVSVMPGNSLTNLPRSFSHDALQELFRTVAKARSDAGLPPGELKTVAQAAATSVWAAVVADAEEVGGRYLEDCAVAPVNDTPNPFADGVRSYALDQQNAAALWVEAERLVGINN